MGGATGGLIDTLGQRGICIGEWRYSIADRDGRYGSNGSSEFQIAELLEGQVRSGRTAPIERMSIQEIT